MSSNHKAPLAAFVVVAIACVVVLATNGMRSYARAPWLQVAAPVVSGARLLPMLVGGDETADGPPAAADVAAASRAPSLPTVIAGAKLHPRAVRHPDRTTEDTIAGASSTDATTAVATTAVATTAVATAPASGRHLGATKRADRVGDHRGRPAPAPAHQHPSATAPHPVPAAAAHGHGAAAHAGRAHVNGAGHGSGHGAGDGAGDRAGQAAVGSGHAAGHSTRH